MAYLTKACFLLILFLEGTKAFHLENVLVKSHLLSTYSYYLIAPELFRDSSFAFATIQTSKQGRDKVGIDIFVTIADKHTENYSKCSLMLKPDDVVNNIIITSLRRLSDKKVVLMGYEAQKNDERKGLLIVLDVKSCETLYLYSSFDLAENNRLVTRETSDKFDIFTNRRRAYTSCAESKSRITFKPEKKESQCFDVDIAWSEIYIGAFSFSEDVVMVRGFDNRGTYKILVYNTAVYPYKQQLWLTLPGAVQKTQVGSSDLAVCWILNPEIDKTVHCSLMEKSGDLRLNKTIVFEEPVQLLSISPSEYVSEIIVVTEKARCEGDNCKNVFISKISDKAVNSRTVELKCSSVDKKRLAIDARQTTSTGTIDLEYVCENLNHFVLYSVNIDDS